MSKVSRDVRNKATVVARRDGIITISSRLRAASGGLVVRKKKLLLILLLLLLVYN